MPEAILIPRPASPEPLDQQSQARERLRSAIAALQEDSDRIAALESGPQRASENQRTAQQALIEAESVLQQAGRIEPEHLAYSFIAGETIDRLPIAEARAQVDRAKSELEHIEEIQQALESEIQRAQGRLRLRRDSVYEALADVVCGSPEFARLFSELDNAWARLRGLRKCFSAIQQALSGHMPGPMMSRWQTVVPLDYDVSYPLDEQPADLWSQALERLLTDPDAVLPSEV
jgi:DNA repair exonuclease SbcCD ATPase subunit